MLVRLISKCGREETRFPIRQPDYDLVDILRLLVCGGYDSLIDHQWLIHELDLDTYRETKEGPAALKFLIPELTVTEDTVQARVSGSRLLECSAHILWVEEGLFLRIIDENLPVEVEPEYQLFRGPARFQATNVDLEIRGGHPYEVVTFDESVIDLLQREFAVTESEE